MKNSKADKKRFASSNHETTELNFLKNATQCIFLSHKKYFNRFTSYNPKFRLSNKPQNIFQTLFIGVYSQRQRRT
jgi:hypothetical protein